MVENVFILAGGSGTRLWPASNRRKPKQFLKVRDGKSLILLTIERALRLSPEVSVYIITLKDQMDGIISECARLESGLARVHVIPEPAPRNTAPAISAGISYLLESGKGTEGVLVLPADHLIEPFESFRSNVESAGKLAEKGFLVTFGIKPLWPATGYGYIETGREESDGYLVNSFKEKPDEETAKTFLRQGNYFWNSGMFVFKVSRFWEELESGSPSIAGVFDGLGKNPTPRKEGGVTVLLDNTTVKEVYKKSPRDSIDYAVMEKCSRSALVQADFDWNDIGSWDEMANLDDGENEKEVFSVESRGNFVLSDIPVALCGVDDLVVVQKNGSLLVCKKGQTQLVKDVVEKIKGKNRGDLL